MGIAMNLELLNTILKDEAGVSDEVYNKIEADLIQYLCDEYTFRLREYAPEQKMLARMEKMTKGKYSKRYFFKKPQDDCEFKLGREIAWMEYE
jgi:hypothetical protein